MIGKCEICYKNLDENDESNNEIYVCKHCEQDYHQNCINILMQKSKLCPVCKSPLDRPPNTGTAKYPRNTRYRTRSELYGTSGTRSRTSGQNRRRIPIGRGRRGMSGWGRYFLISIFIAVMGVVTLSFWLALLGIGMFSLGAIINMRQA